MAYSSWMLEDAEYAMCPDKVRTEWNYSQETRKDNKGKEYTIYYYAPKPHKHGYGTALTPEAREWGIQQIIKSHVDKAKKTRLVWC